MKLLNEGATDIETDLSFGLGCCRENWVLMVFDSFEKSSEERRQCECDGRNSEHGQDGP